MEDIELKIGSRLKELREEKGLSLREVAERLGCSHASVYCWETGQRSLYAKTLYAYCKVLGISVTDFFDGIK